jgi:hypothetical protein
MGMAAAGNQDYAQTLGGIMAGLVPTREGLSADVMLKSLAHGPDFWMRAFDIKPQTFLTDVMSAGLRFASWQARALQDSINDLAWSRAWLGEVQGKWAKVLRAQARASGPSNMTGGKP